MVLLGLTVAQLAVGAFGDLDQYDGKGFGYRLLVYPLLMLLVPAVWWWRTRDASRPALGCVRADHGAVLHRHHRQHP